MRYMLFGAIVVANMLPAMAVHATNATGKGDAACPDPATIEANKKLATAMFQGPPKPEEMGKAGEIMDKDYVQHNPEFRRFGEINHLHGREEFLALMPMMMGADGPFAPPPPDAPKGNPLYKVLADCDMVVVLQQRYLPDPQYKGKYYEAFWFDAWRVKDGKLLEHWDAAEIPAKLPQYLLKPLSQLPQKPAAPAAPPPAKGGK
jgi:predicted SnoaL-like aldol condensation-catalyzing enzyme